jgi:hypothetical protein
MLLTNKFQTVLVFLTIITSALQLLVQKMNYKKDLARIELITSRARRAAWGPKLIPTTGQRKVRVSLGEQHDDDGFSEGTKFIEMVVEGMDVYIVSPLSISFLIGSERFFSPTMTAC